MKGTDVSNQMSEFACPIEVTLSVLGGRWKLGILFHLFNGKMRFNQMKKEIPGVSQRILTLQLRELENDNIIKRTVYEEVPPRVEYELTAFGESLKPVVDEMSAWGAKYFQQVSKNRETEKSPLTSHA